MEVVRSVTVAGPAARAFAFVDDLERYPDWMSLVHAVDPDPTPVDHRPAWEVELQAQVGPFARSKRLRMVRTEHEPDVRVVFERAETDGRQHAPWVLTVDLATRSDERAVNGSAAIDVTMTLSYGGSLWSGAVLQRVLDDHVERGAQRLRDLVAEPS